MVGKYQLIDRVGVGGMAEVFRARPLGEPGGSPTVVVKRILPHLAEDPEFRAMFMDEARIAACLDHPNVVKLIDLGRAGAELYLVLEYVDGASLSRLLSRAREKARRLPLSATLQVMIGILAGLDHAHRRLGPDGKPLSIVHRDVGPGNVLVSWGGSVKLSDFGVAKATMRAGHTVPGVIKGNIPYMAPEQVTSEKPVDARADVYGAGMLLQTLLTGRNPLDDEPLPRVLDRILSGNVIAPTDPDEVPPAMVEILERATARDPDARFADAASFSDALFAAGRTLRAEPSKMVLSAIMWDLLPGPEKTRELEREQSDSGSPSIVKRLGPLIEEAAAEDLVSADLSALEENTPAPTPTPRTIFASALPRDPAQIETTHRTPHRTPTPKPDLHPVLDLDDILGDPDTTKVRFDPLLTPDPSLEPSGPSRIAPPPPEPSLTSPSSGPMAWARLVGHREAVSAVAITPDSRRAVSASHDQTLKVWDIEERREVATLAGHRAAVTSVAVSADGRFVLSGSRDRTLRLWSLETGETLGVLEGHTAWVFSVGLSTNGALAVSGGFDRTVRLWEISTGKCLLALSGHRDTVSAAAISDDGKAALSASYDKTLRWWDLAASSVKTIRTTGMDSVRTVKLWQNGPVALSGGADAKVRLWNLLDGSPIRTLSGHLEPVVAVSFSPDGKRIASASYDGSVRIWSVGNGAELVRLSPGHEPVMSLAFSPDGKRLITAGADRQLAIFEL